MRSSGPDEPDIALYVGYPIPPDSFRRKLWRDATGQTGWKLLKGLFRAARSSDRRHAARRPLDRRACSSALAAISALAGYPLVYWLLWFLPYMTAVAGHQPAALHRRARRHDPLERPPPRPPTRCASTRRPASCSSRTGSAGTSPTTCDSGIPMRHLPRYHRELVRSGYVAEGLEYASYPALWRALSSGPPRPATA